MEIQVTTDNNIDGREALVRHVETELAAKLEYVSAGLTRVEVHLSDESSGRSTSDDMRCVLEARPTGQKPVAVTGHAATLEAAFRVALTRLTSLLESTSGRRDDRNRRDTIRHP